MAIAQLFLNLHNYRSVDFSEGEWELGAIASLFPLNFDESGMQIKEILESTYTDGITGLESVENDGKKITGIFLDQVSPTITKRYRFTIAPDNISYQLENPDDLDSSNFAELEYAATKMFGGSKKPKNCTKGTSCGNGCINKNKQCNIKPNPQQKETIKQVLDKTPSEKTVPKKPATKSKQVAPSKPNDEPVSKNGYTIDNEKDFEDVALNKFAALHDKYNGQVPIYELRRELGETVPRDKFNEYMLELQSQGKLQFQGGSVEDSAPDKIKDSLMTPLDGIRGYVRLGKESDLNSIKEAAKKTNAKTQELLKDKKPLSELGTAGNLANGPKIKNQDDFNKTIQEAHTRLNAEFNYDDLVPIGDLRKSLGDRVSKEEFDTMIKDYLDSNDNARFSAKNKAPDSEDGITDFFGNKKHYLQLGMRSAEAAKEAKKYPRREGVATASKESAASQKTKTEGLKKRAGSRRR